MGSLKVSSLTRQTSCLMDRHPSSPSPKTSPPTTLLTTVGATQKTGAQILQNRPLRASESNASWWNLKPKPKNIFSVTWDSPVVPKRGWFSKNGHDLKTPRRANIQSFSKTTLRALPATTLHQNPSELTPTNDLQNTKTHQEQGRKPKHLAKQRKNMKKRLLKKKKKLMKNLFLKHVETKKKQNKDPPAFCRNVPRSPHFTLLTLQQQLPWRRSKLLLKICEAKGPTLKAKGFRGFYRVL